MNEITEWLREPTLLDLEHLERIGDRRTEIEAVEADGDGPAHRRRVAIRRLLLDTLDEMEEELCLYGHRAPLVVEGWQKLACFESFGLESRRPTRGGPAFHNGGGDAATTRGRNAAPGKEDDV